MGDPALKVFSSIIPILAENMLFSSQASQEIAEFVDFVEDQEVLRQQVVASGILYALHATHGTNVFPTGLVAFVPNGAILPRESGASDTPMMSPNVVPFMSPPNSERTFVLPHRGQIAGMGIPRGITMIAGGGFHVSAPGLTRVVQMPIVPTV